MSFTLISSPLQGLTDFRFRNAFNTYFEGIDTFYAPFVRLNKKCEIKPAYERDLLPENNSGIKLVPQIVTNDADACIFAAQYVQQLGYTELNWNLGCPFPMVAKRGMGSGLIQYPETINSILGKFFSETEVLLSIKMRLGYESSEEIFQAFPVLNNYPLKNIAIHPRIGKQLYKGDVDLEAFKRCIDNTNHTLCYNGDITSTATFNDMRKRFPTIEHWMIGRGLIADPFLPGRIRNATSEYPENRLEIFSQFHDTLLHDYSQALSGASHILMKMLQLWDYFKLSFPDSRKEFKKIKKTKSLAAYKDAVQQLLDKEKTNT